MPNALIPLSFILALSFGTKASSIILLLRGLSPSSDKPWPEKLALIR